jgi:hypothetical protein
METLLDGFYGRLPALIPGISRYSEKRAFFTPVPWKGTVRAHVRGSMRESVAETASELEIAAPHIPRDANNTLPRGRRMWNKTISLIYNGIYKSTIFFIPRFRREITGRSCFPA